jgi:hypothetical protein
VEQGTVNYIEVNTLWHNTVLLIGVTADPLLLSAPQRLVQFFSLSDCGLLAFATLCSYKLTPEFEVTCFLHIQDWSN